MSNRDVWVAVVIAALTAAAEEALRNQNKK
jgi:hypothetical protein